MNNDQLLPCPLCGGEQVTTAPDREFGDVTWDAICKACGCSVRRDREDAAITAWNSRTPSHGRVSDSEDGRLPAAPGLRGFAPEPAAQSQPKALVPDVDHLSARHLYEGVAGGWKDGRFGQAYDLIAEALKERGVIELHGHKLLIDIEMEDMNYE